MKVPGRHRVERLICDACSDSRKPKFKRGREHRSSPDEHEAIRALIATGDSFHQEFAVGPFWFDFAVPRVWLLVEVDSHTYHRFPRQQARDRRKQAYAEKLGWTVCRVRRPDVTGKVRAAYDAQVNRVTLGPGCDRHDGAGAERGGVDPGGELRV